MEALKLFKKLLFWQSLRVAFPFLKASQPCFLKQLKIEGRLSPPDIPVSGGNFLTFRLVQLKDSQHAEVLMSDEIKFITPFGINEEDYVRVAEEGGYYPTVMELLSLIPDGEITINEAKILYHVFKKTICFRQTHKRCKRKEIYEAINMSKPKFYSAKNSLIKKGYLLEIKDKDDYYFYGLNPFKFNGLIVLKSKELSITSINREEKRRQGFLKSTKKEPGEYQKGTAWVTKWYPEDLVTIQNYSAFEILKYTFLKYTLLNGLSALSGKIFVEILEKTNNPEYIIKQFVKLMHDQPSNVRGIFEELKRANSHGTDIENRPIQTNVAVYVLACWDKKIKGYWQNIQHRVDDSQFAIENRKELYEVIQSYLIISNVVTLNKQRA